MKFNGKIQNAGVVKIISLDGKNPQNHAKCLQKCLAHPGATGCEVKWSQRHRGCYIHTKEIAGGNYAHNYACWVFSKCKGKSSYKLPLGIKHYMKYFLYSDI